tara:strand:- start:736 stop:852 length:117 start_codon:yes stop_codon:yes gene_type:complete
LRKFDFKGSLEQDYEKFGFGVGLRQNLEFSEFGALLSI